MERHLETTVDLATHDEVRPRLASADFPALFIAADAASRDGQRGHKRLLRAEIALLLAAALISVIGDVFPTLGGRWERILAALLLVIALALKVATRYSAYDQTWFDGRAVAETVKSTAWRFAMRVPPYAGDDAEADAAFMKDIDAALAARSSLIPHLGHLPAGGQQITAAMRRLRHSPVDERRAVYLEERVANQIDWYAGKSAANGRAAGRWFWVGLVFETAALGFAIFQITAEGIPDLVGLLAAVAIAATALTQLDRHDELSKSYALAAYELTRMRLPVETAPEETAFTRAVDAVEAAVSREHTMWMAKRT